MTESLQLLGMHVCEGDYVKNYCCFLFNITESACGDAFINSTGYITRKSEKESVDVLTDNGTNFLLDLMPRPLLEDDDDD